MKDDAKKKPEKPEPPNRLEEQDFPPADDVNKIIAHNGLTPAERATALRLGYDLRDVRFIAGRLGAELTMLGVRQRTVVLDAAQLRAVLAELAQYAKMDSSVGNQQTVVNSVGDDVLGWFHDLGTTSTGAKADQPTSAAEPVPIREEQKPRRGRPPGKKDSKPRARRSSPLSPESDQAMRNAIAQINNEDPDE